MAVKYLKTRLYSFIFSVLFIQICAFTLHAQSTDQNFPTAITSNEISGRIAARDVGDSRLTTYFYAFDGTQGDVFINVEATNLNGDIDVFTVGNLRPLTKISLFAGDTTAETGRVVYLRKPEKLILRVEGRTPNDNAATFRIKFAGSFVALQAKQETDEPKLPEVKASENNGIKVNSVGTIIEVKPKPTPKPKETVAEKQETEKEEIKSEETKPKEEAKTEEKKETEEAKEEKKSDETIAEKEVVKSEPEVKKLPAKTRKNKVKPVEKKVETAENKEAAGKPEKTEVSNEPAKKATSKTRKNTKQTSKEPEPNPLENVRLTVLFKDGTKFEKPMPEVIRFSVDKGTLTIITKDGKIERFQIVNVAKMTVE